MRPALAAAVLVALGSTANADSEKALSAGLGWATFSIPGSGPPMNNQPPPAVTPDLGGALSVMYEQMIGSDVGIRAELAGGLFRGGEGEDQSPTSYAGLADAGLVFRFDVLKYVPYAFAGLGVVYTGGGPITGGFDPVLAIGGGLDILHSRQYSYGFEGRLASFGGDVTVFTLGIRGTTRWGYF